MEHVLPFRDVLEAVDRLTVEEQETLLAVVRRRLSDVNRKQLSHDVAEARQEFAAGGCTPTTPDDILREILS